MNKNGGWSKVVKKRRRRKKKEFVLREDSKAILCSSLGVTNGFRTQGKSLGKNITVRAQRLDIYIKCKNRDEATTREKIYTMLREQFKFEELGEES